MLGSLALPHIPCEKCTDLSCKPFTFGRGLGLSLLLPRREAAHWCPRAWGVGTGKKKNILRFWEVFLRHLLRDYIPEKCAKRVEDLTDRIVRMQAYPMAYGGFSDVWSCQLRHKQKPLERVAVKAVRPAIANEKEYQIKQKAVEQELGVWVGLDHPNVLPLYGITLGFGPFPAFVCPWAHHGTLSEYLEKFNARLDLKKRLTLLGDIAAGLEYLHSRNIVHGDLSGLNVLVTKRERACLSDFGLSTLIEQVSDTTSSDISFPGNIRWAAPELLDGCKEGTPVSQLSSRQADIYSFGSIMLQTLSGKPPFHEIQRVAQIVIMISRGSRPPRVPRWDGKAIPDVLWEFIETCWAKDPAKRPSSEDIVRFIRCQLSRMSKTGDCTETMDSSIY